MGQEKVTDLRVFQETCNAMNRNTEMVHEKCNQSLSDANRVLNDTQQELAYSNWLLQEAIEDENRKLIEMHEREAEVAEASAGLPKTAAWYADAVRRLAIAVEEYEKAVAHRILMEQRVELANQCVIIATEMVETLIAKYNYGQNQIVQYSEVGISRLNTADRATSGYQEETLLHYSSNRFTGNNSLDGAGENKGLTVNEKKMIKKKTGWSDDILSKIGSMEEAEIYMGANLKESEINGKKCLISADIDLNRVDEDGISNRERMQRGLAPYEKNGNKVELHHIGQHAESPLAELTMEQHRGTGNDTILHDKSKESEIDRNRFNTEKSNHWKDRAS